jgi:hypothetical protein
MTGWRLSRDVRGGGGVRAGGRGVRGVSGLCGVSRDVEHLFG